MHWQKALARAADRVGLVVAKAPGPRTLPRALGDVFRALAIDCVIDVGANGGQYGEMLRRHAGFEGRIASVEPASAAFARLKAACAPDDRWQAFNYALGDHDGESTLHIGSNDVFNSLHELNDYGAELFSEATAGAETVAVRRLDAVFDQLAGGCSCVFLKCDTQGHDLAVLSGLGDRAVLGLQVELSFVPIYDEIPDWLTVENALRLRGFGPVDYFPVNRAADGLSLLEADGVFVRA